MEEAARSPLIAWESFYVIVGSSGAALTGLQFVVIAYCRVRVRATARQIDAFGTPRSYISALCLVFAIMSAPWPGLRVSLLPSAPGGVGRPVRRDCGSTSAKPDGLPSGF